MQIYDDNGTHNEQYCVSSMPPPQITLRVRKLYLSFFTGYKYETVKGFQIRYQIQQLENAGICIVFDYFRSLFASVMNNSSQNGRSIHNKYNTIAMQAKTSMTYV